MKEVGKITGPLFLTTIVSSLLTFSDMAFVGPLGVNSISSVAAGGAAFSLLAQIVSSSIIGFQILGAEHSNDQKENDINEIFNTNLLMMLGISITLLIISILLLSPFVSLFSSVEIISMAKKYFLFRVGSLIVIPIFLSLKTSFDLQKKTQIGFMASLVILLSNIILNFILIVMLEMGVVGASLTSTLSLVIGTSYLFFVLSKNNKYNIKICLSIRKINYYFLEQLKKINVPETMNMLIDYLGTALLSMFIATLGVYTIAGGKIAMMYLMNIFALGMCISVTTQLLLSKSNTKNEMRSNIRSILKFSFIFFVPIGIIFITFSLFWARLFTTSLTLQSLVQPAIQIVGVCAIIIPMLTICIGILRANKKNKSLMYSNAFSIWCIQVPVSLYYGKILGLLGVMLGFLAYFLIRTILSIILIRRSGFFKETFKDELR